MSHFRTHIANTPGQILRLIALADHPNLAVLLDTYHMITEVRDYAAAIRTVGSKLWGLHVCENDRGVPGGGLVPWDQVAAALREIAFDGYVMLEAYNSSLDDFAYRRGMFHDVCPDGVAFARTGLGFLKDRLGEMRPIMTQAETANISDPTEAGSADAVIIGGGIIGAATAFFLARAGLRPLLVERRPALASLTSAHSMESFRAQFDEPENVAMMRESIAFYEAFAENTGLPDWDIGIHQQGYLFLTTEPARAGDFRQRVARPARARPDRRRTPDRRGDPATLPVYLGGSRGREPSGSGTVGCRRTRRPTALRARRASRSCWRPRPPASCSGTATRPASRPTVASSPAPS